MNRKKITSKHENKRIGHKKARAAERQVLEGGCYSRRVYGLGWGDKIEQPHIPDDIPSTRPRKKNKRKWCKGQVGKEHQWVQATKYYGSTPYAITRCERCHKQKWGRIEVPIMKPAGSNHWSNLNIWRRLAGKYCLCDECDREVRELFE